MADRRDDSEQRLRRLAGAVRRARLALLWEAVWPRLVPLATVAGLFVALSWFGLWRVMPDAARVGLLAVFGLAALAALVPLIRLPLPRDSEAVKRVERVSELDHRPASGLRDQLSPVADDAAAKAMWAAHRLRLLAAIGSLKAGAPHPDLIRRDPNALRFAVPVLLIVGFAMATGEHLLRIQEAFTPVGTSEAAVPMRVDAWIDPPAYTGQAPVFLTRREGRNDVVTIPESSRLTVRVVSDEPAEVIVETLADSQTLEPEQGPVSGPAPDGVAAVQPAAAPGGAIRSYRAELDIDGEVIIRSGGEETRYIFSVIPDRPPTISRGPVTLNRAGSFTMDFEVADDYGVTGGSVTFRPKDQPGDARPLVEPPEVALRLPRSARREGTARAHARIEDHPFAGLEVDADAVAVDAAGQEGRPAEDGTMQLPARPFRNPIARALVEQRQILAQDARAQGRVAMAIEAMTLWPERFIDNASIYLGLVVAHRRLVMAQTDDELRDMLDYLWTMARTIEDGILSDAEERLNAAREALEQALAEGASDEEIARLTEELRQALNEYMQSMMAEMARRGGELPDMPMDPNMQMLSQRDLDRMLDRIEEMARMGDRESAQALLDQLQQMLDNLQMAQRGQMGDGDQGEMMQMMEEIARMMREQQQLMDDTFRLDQGQRPQNRGQQQQGEQGPLSPSEMAEIMRRLQQGQSDLHQGLQQLLEQMQQGQMGEDGQAMPGQGESPGERSLGRAGRSMDDAARSLGQGDTGPAYGQQGEALEALREGLQGMMEQMFGQEGQPGQQFGQGQPRGRTDPLGRPQRTEGPDLGLDVQIPDEIDVERARRILNAIRERLGERYRPRFELDYLERLLNGQ
jgi:uncharacterized protein (TIGR02302 family)